MSTPPPHLLEALTQNVWENGLDCMLCQAYRPLEDFTLVRG